MKKQYEQVKTFHEAAGIEMPEVPTMLERSNEDVFYSVRVESVADELKSDAKNYGISPVSNRASYMLEEVAEFLDARTIEDQADALTDLLYFTLGTFTLMGINPEPIFNIVARANLGKIVDGKVLRDVQGKIRKPDGWHEKHAPEREIKEEIERQGQL